MKYALFGIGVVVAVAAGATGDYRLIVQGEPTPSCAKSLADCEKARAAISKGWLLSVPAEALTRCEPAPGCFPDESNYIRGYNLPAR